MVEIFKFLLLLHSYKLYSVLKYSNVKCESVPEVPCTILQQSGPPPCRGSIPRNCWRQLSYAIKKGAYNKTFPCMEATYPFVIKNQRGARNPP